MCFVTFTIDACTIRHVVLQKRDIILVTDIANVRDVQCLHVAPETKRARWSRHRDYHLLAMRAI